MTDPAKPVELKKIDKLAYFETDILRRLVEDAQEARQVADQTPEAQRALRFQQKIKNYCNQIILRHHADPSLHAVNGDFEWIVAIPPEQLDAAIRAKIDAQKLAEAATKSAKPGLELVPDPEAPEAPALDEMPAAPEAIPESA